MSLMIHLPLNGHTNNQGLLDVDLQVTGATYKDGKLGKCLNKGGVLIPAEGTEKVLNNDELTIAFWIYVNAEEGNTTNRVMIFGNNAMTANNNRKFSLFQYPTCNDFHWSWMNDAENTMFCGSFIKGVLPSYQWTHVAVVYKNPTINIYINGQLKWSEGGKVSNSSTFAYDTQMIYNSEYHMFNDYRIYNNAISPKEVRLLSQGLMCHYPMSMIDGNIIGRNLLDSSGLIDWNGRNWGDGVINNIIINEVTSEGWHFKTGNTGVSNSNGICINFERKNSGLKTGDVVTFSVDVKGTIDSGSPYIQYWSTTTSSSDFWNRREFGDLMDDVKSDEWTRYSVTVTLRDLYTGKDSDYFCVGGGYNADLYVKNAKVELGSSPTPYMTSLKDTPEMYDNTIYDTSGFGHHGWITSSSAPTIYNDSPRYNCCYKFNGSSNYIGVQNPINSTATDFSIACWAYFTKNTVHTIYTARTAVGVGVAVFFLGGVIRLDDEVHTEFDYLVTTNCWHHICVTRSNTAKKLYVDGNLVSTKDEVGTLQGVGTKGTIGGSENSDNGIPKDNWTNGYLSDFRIYATALSAEDVMNLYKTPVSITNTGTLMTQGEFIEQ